jgi:hypothetical protein
MLEMAVALLKTTLIMMCDGSLMLRPLHQESQLQVSLKNLNLQVGIRIEIMKNHGKYQSRIRKRVLIKLPFCTAFTLMAKGQILNLFKC